MYVSGLYTDKLNDLQDALKEYGLWQDEVAGENVLFSPGVLVTANDYARWLQDVFFTGVSLPARIKTGDEKRTTMLQAIKFFSIGDEKGKLLQILIEVDALM